MQIYTIYFKCDSIRIDFKKNLKIKLSKIKFKYFIFETLILFNHEKTALILLIFCVVFANPLKMNRPGKGRSRTVSSGAKIVVNLIQQTVIVSIRRG
jgi:hypothetical protein